MNIWISLDALKGDEGWVLAEPIYNTAGLILCPAERTLDKTTIEQLKKHYSKFDTPLDKVGIKVKFDSNLLSEEQKQQVKFIQEQDNDIPEIIPQQLHNDVLEAIRKTYLISEKNMADTMKIVEECMEDIASRIKQEEFSYSLGQYKNPFTVSDVSEHSLRVAQFAVTLANIYNQNISASEDHINLKSIGTAALLHDYGVCFKDNNEMKKLSLYQLSNSFRANYPTIPEDVLQMPYDEKYRTVYAYTALKNFLDNSTLTMILLSSESENGYVGLNIKNNKNDTTSIGSQIIFLCNLYDSLLHNTIKNDESLENVSAALSQLAENGATNKSLTTLFTDNIPLYSVGVRVQLSTGDYATVVERFKGKDASRPVVKTLVNPPLTPNTIDLRTTTTITISKIIGSNEKLSNKINEITQNQLKTMGVTSINFEDNIENNIEDTTENNIDEEEEKKFKAM